LVGIADAAQMRRFGAADRDMSCRASRVSRRAGEIKVCRIIWRITGKLYVSRASTNVQSIQLRHRVSGAIYRYRATPTDVHDTDFTPFEKVVRRNRFGI